MEKIEYDSLHKFLVSLGLIFIALPFVFVFFILNKDVKLISQEEFDALSSYSQCHLQGQDYWMDLFVTILPKLCCAFFLVGAFLLFVGIKNWGKVQKDLDAVTAANRIKLELETEEMKQSDKLKQTVEEVQEAGGTTSPPPQSVIMKHMDIEDQYFSKVLPNAIKRKYFIKRNLKVGKYEYDGIAISKTDNIDLIYEIKIWRQPRSTQMLRTTFERLYSAGVNYETLKHRNFRCVLVIVTTTANLSEMEQWVQRFSHDGVEYDFSNIQIEYVAEEMLSV